MANTTIMILVIIIIVLLLALFKCLLVIVESEKLAICEDELNKLKIKYESGEK
jgi:hypothetical protein